MGSGHCGFGLNDFDDCTLFFLSIERYGACSAYRESLGVLVMIWATVIMLLHIVSLPIGRQPNGCAHLVAVIPQWLVKLVGGSPGWCWRRDHVVLVHHSLLRRASMARDSGSTLTSPAGVRK